ncbi:hypothetical protein GALMADRAFT_280580 [Galerina marginata CBS 339.88]|uniref:Peptidase C14 caspase domain-containing protein n=1 Tax=Galerina marginata (strain CBS 339.88) TaxID=685588 RepID=A0A067T2C9_GALM3|nr:hypothetical protein GALMADRAFT_280580 [Galerina marginata CBS 339.88]
MAIYSSWTSPFPRLFALIIGINVYDPKEDFLRLRGAVRDAYAYKDYLMDCLEVPEDHIRILINKQASRAAILDAFLAIKDDPRIQEGDPIFIFYAGHGSEIEPPLGWESGGPNSKVQLLVPQDYCSVAGLEIPGIPDRTIGALLEDIADKKGNNITVVLDCCHSASGTRGPNSKSVGRARSVALKPTIHTKDLDRKTWSQGSEEPQNVSPFRFSGLRSHTLIAACRSSELAVEFNRNGSFSAAFLKLLKSVPPNQLRYSEVLARMDHISGQNPQIEGVNQDRYLFDAKSSSPSSSGYPLRQDKILHLIFIDAGMAHGIAVGTEFVTTGSNVGTPPATLVVEKANSYSSVLTFNDQWWAFLSSADSTTTVVQARAGKLEPLRLYVSPGTNYQASRECLLPLLQNPDYGLHNVSLVDEPDSAHLKISVERNKAIIRLIDKRVRKYGLNPRFPTIDAHPDKMVPFFQSASQYFWELYRKSDDVGLMKDVQVSFYELNECQSPFSDVKRPELSATGRNLYQDNQVNIVVKEDRIYGIKLTNNSLYDLYPRLLYFDNVDLNDISEHPIWSTATTTCYKPNSSGPYHPDCPLKANGGTLTIGYGSGGMAPLSYSLPEGQDLAIGFLKLFVFTQPLDSLAFSRPSEPPETRSEKWDTLLIPVVQRRYRFHTPPVRPANVWPETRVPRDRRTSFPGSFVFGHTQTQHGYSNLAR